MATLNTLIARLRREISVSQGESFNNERLTEFLTDSLTQHNSAYSWASLPANEELAIIFLSASKAAFDRAQKLANKPSSSVKSGSFNTSVEADHQTPFDKNMKLYRAFLDRYEGYCASIGVSTNGSGGGIVKGRVTKRDSELEALTPLASSEPISSVLLSSAQGDDNTELILSWVSEAGFNFSEWVIFTLPSSDSIHRSWNLNTNGGIPQINTSATKVATINDPTQKSVKITGINRAVDNSFLVVGVTRSQKFTYSNEILLTLVP